jgi:hypothetical protein
LKSDRGASGIIAREENRVALLEPASPLTDFDTPETYQVAASVNMES